MPVALIVATARVAGADLVVTNDRAWEGPMSTAYPDLPVVVLADTA
jgi:hypothetical protein